MVNARRKEHVRCSNLARKRYIQLAYGGVNADAAGRGDNAVAAATNVARSRIVCMVWDCASAW